MREFHFENKYVALIEERRVAARLER